MSKSVSFMLIGACLCLASCEHERTYTYVDYVRNATVIFDPEKGTVSDNHIILHMKSCDAAYNCIDVGAFVFAVPKTFPLNDSWRLGGATYSNKGQRNVVILGMPIDAYLVEQDIGGHKNWFLYSKEKGLIGMGTVNAERSFNYWLQGECGFGAVDEC